MSKENPNVSLQPIQKEQEIIEVNPNNRDICSLCSSNAIVFDAETNETLCSSCGMILHDNAEALDPELRTYSTDDIESKTRTGMPTSLAFHDMGLSTHKIISLLVFHDMLFMK